MPIVEVAGCRQGTGPITWGQRSILRIMLMLDDAAHTTNLGSWAPMPDGTNIAAALAWITHLIEVYDSPRTRYVRTGGDWTQIVDGAGTLPVEVIEVQPDQLAETASALQTAMRRIPFDFSVEWQLRMRILAHGDQALGVVWTSSHLMADLHGMWAFNNALGKLGAPPPPGVQPLDEAAFEQSAAGHNTNAQAIAYWRSELEDAATRSAVEPVHPPHEGLRYWSCDFRSPALSAALSKLARAHRTTTSVALFAAVAASLAEFTGTDAVTMTTVGANRVRRDVRAAVGTFSQLVPVTIQVADQSWPELINRTAMRLLTAMRRGMYDLRSLNELQDLVTKQYGALPDLSQTFNDIRGDLNEVSTDDPATLPRGTVQWGDGTDDSDSTLYLWVYGGQRGPTSMRLSIDTRRFTTGQAESILHAVEDRLLKESADSADQDRSETA